jgi:3-oxoacyl-[acyl-carrier protein] reductase
VPPAQFASAAEIFDLSGEVVVVTGASSGLGRRFAEVLAAAGARVALVGRDAERLARAAEEIGSRGGTVCTVRHDISDHRAAPEMLEAVERDLGPVSVLVNNAGIPGEGAGAQIAFEHWRHIIDVNLDAVFSLSAAAARLMETRGGTIVNISSIMGLRPPNGHAAYAVAKAGVVQLTRVMAVELAAKGIRVNALAPGYVVTGMNREFFGRPESARITNAIPLGRVGQVEDFDGAILFLASRASRFMTGATLVIDGGHTLVT